MNLGSSYPTTGEAYLSNTFQLPPANAAIELAKAISVADSFARRNRFNSSYFADDFKVHCEEHTINLHEYQISSPVNCAATLNVAISFEGLSVFAVYEHRSARRKGR
jgi:hypothetical protein